jgi:hypothetical protein
MPIAACGSGGGADVSETGPRYVVVGDAGFVSIGDALLADPEFWADGGQLVGVDGGLAAATVCAQSSDCTWASALCYWRGRCLLARLGRP